MDNVDITLHEDIVPKEMDLGKQLEVELEKASITPTPPPTGSPEEPTSLTGKPEEPVGDTGPARDEKGRFKSKEAKDAAIAAGDPTAAAAEIAPPAETSAAKPEDVPPISWKDEQKVHWSKVPPEVRTYLHQRENELQQGFQKVAQRANVAEAVLNEFQPYADTLAKEGATPIAAIRTLLQTAHALRTGDPEYRKAIIFSLADQYGVNLQEPLNPDLATAQARAAQLSIEKMYGQSQQDAFVQRQIEQEYNTFATDPKNEFFPQVRTIMAGLINNNMANDLKSAYDMALGMHPEVRKTIIERETTARLDEARRRQAATVSVSGAPGGAAMSRLSPNGKADDLRGTLERALGGEMDRL